MSTACIIFGIFVAFYGRKFFPPVIGATGGLAAFLLSLLACSYMDLLTRLEGN